MTPCSPYCKDQGCESRGSKHSLGFCLGHEAQSAWPPQPPGDGVGGTLSPASLAPLPQALSSGSSLQPRSSKLQAPWLAHCLRPPHQQHSRPCWLACPSPLSSSLWCQWVAAHCPKPALYFHTSMSAQTVASAWMPFCLVHLS